MKIVFIIHWHSVEEVAESYYREILWSASHLYNDLQ